MYRNKLWDKYEPSYFVKFPDLETMVRFGDEFLALSQWEPRQPALDFASIGILIALVHTNPNKMATLAIKFPSVSIVPAESLPTSFNPEDY